MDTFFFIRIEGEGHMGPYLSFTEASTIMMDYLPDIVTCMGDGKIEKYTSEIVERVIEGNHWVDVGIRARDIRILKVE